MPFIGKQPQAGAYSKLDSITTSATATYNLTLGGSAYYPSSANHLLVSLNGVLQAPQDSFTVSGSQITFASALTSADSIDFIMALGDVLDIGTPSAGATVPGDFNVNGDFKTSNAGSAKITLESLGSNNQGGLIFSGNNATDGSFRNTIDVKSTGNTEFLTDTTSALSGANVNTLFKYQGTEYLRLGTNGISFDSGSNYLDDYEEGSWTPEYGGGASSITVGNYTIQDGKYIKIGRLVWVGVALACNTVTVNTDGTFDIINLPFTVASGGQGAMMTTAQNTWTVAPSEFTFVDGANTARARQGLNFGASGYTNGLAATMFNTGTSGDRNRIYAQGTYWTDS